MPMDLATALAEVERLTGLVDSLRTALQLKEARARYRDAAKEETTRLLGLQPDASIHEILAAIRGVVAERDRLRQQIADERS